jgi:UDP-N-acetyl-D-galactosamine dehydrogenase
MKTPEGTVAVVGLGYVGLPLAASFAKHLKVIAFDINAKRVEELAQGIDRTGEVLGGNLKNPNFTFTSDGKLLRQA